MRRARLDPEVPTSEGVGAKTPETQDGSPGLTRRRVLGLLAATPVASLAWSPLEIARAHDAATAARAAVAGRGQAFEPEFFTAHEYRTVRLLVDMILPADDRSGSATDAGVPEFMDFIMSDGDDDEEERVWMRGGLAWLDVEAQERFDRPFVDCEEAERREILDDVAWPERAPDELSHGVAFFNRFRDLTATGFWTSEMGVRDIGYVGNRVVATWNGCPDEVLEHLGLASPEGAGAVGVSRWRDETEG